MMNLFWYLPCKARRVLYQLTYPRKFHKLQLLRDSTFEYSLRGFDKNNCIFIHIPKTGGVSVAMSLFGHLVGHRVLRQYRLLFSCDEYQKYFKFAFVRNPWDRLLSAYLFLKKGGLYPQDKVWADKYLDPYPTFEDFVTGWVTPENILTQKHFQPQFIFVRGTTNQPDLDFIGFFESLADDFQRVCRKLDLNTELRHMNRGSAVRDYRDYYTRSTKAIVEYVYREDILQFDYGFGSSSSG